LHPPNDIEREALEHSESSLAHADNGDVARAIFVAHTSIWVNVMNSIEVTISPANAGRQTVSKWEAGSRATPLGAAFCVAAVETWLGGAFAKDVEVVRRNGEMRRLRARVLRHPLGGELPQQLVRPTVRDKVRSIMPPV
jgi:hypothetical protein